MSHAAADSLPPPHNARTGCTSPHLPYGTQKCHDLPNASIANNRHRAQFLESNDCTKPIEVRDSSAAQLIAKRRSGDPPLKYTALRSKDTEKRQANEEVQQYHNRMQERMASS